MQTVQQPEKARVRMKYTNRTTTDECRNNKRERDPQKGHFGKYMHDRGDFPDSSQAIAHQI